MNKLIIVVSIAVLSALVLFACNRDEGVRASTAPADTVLGPGAPPDKPGNQEIRGELIRVDVPGKMFSVRIENGMEQTFRFEEQTMVMGLENPPAATSAGAPGTPVRSVVDKVGSEVTIQWIAAGDTAKVATSVAVTEIVSNVRRGSRKRYSRF